ncbi:MAG: DUF502 domain-containing protein [Acidobacteria bacterium]|nr:DUF502 domain-containing protein [Acidobacteriota bacterium]
MKIVNFIKKHIFTGILALLPVIGTFWVLSIIYNFFADLNVSFIEDIIGFQIPGIQIIFVIIVLFLIGFIVNTSIGKSIFKYSEVLLSKVPMVRGVYGGIKQLTDTLTSKNEGEDARVVLVQYPRVGLWQLGFVTNEAWSAIQEKSGANLINILMPTSPNPTGGMLILAPKEDIIPLDMSYNEGMKYVVSGGVVTPEDFNKDKQ